MLLCNCINYYTKGAAEFSSQGRAAKISKISSAAPRSGAPRQAKRAVGEENFIDETHFLKENRVSRSRDPATLGVPVDGTLASLCAVVGAPIFLPRPASRFPPCADISWAEAIFGDFRAKLREFELLF